MNDSSDIYQQVNNHYGTLAQGAEPLYSSTIAKAFGYTQEQLNSIPAEANLGVSCGNPLAIASLHEGETVIDLGCGAGFDVFLASQKIGATGHAIGVDMNQDMLARARRNQVNTPGASNVSFVESKITSIPLQDDIADCIISNCVINLIPEYDKPKVFAEMARLLKPSGRVAVSDILARKPLPKGLRDSVALYVGCVAGASTKEDYMLWLKDAGFDDVVIVDAESDLNVYMNMAREAQALKRTATGCCKPSAPDLKLSGEGERGYAQEEATGACCSEAEDKATVCCDRTCCGKHGKSREDATGDEQGAVAEDYNFSHVDINEWAGSFKIFAVKK